MFRLIYSSRASDWLTDRHVSEILAQSQLRNDREKVTGFLAFNNRCFLQVLEGPRKNVMTVFDSIEKDERHFGIVQLLGAEISERAFPGWAMNYHRVDGDEGDPTMMVRYDDTLAALLSDDTPRDLLFMFTNFMTLKTGEGRLAPTR